jgi:signal peptidase II
MQKALIMKKFSRLAVLSITILSCVGCDQSTKMVAQSHLRGHSSISFFDSMFYFVYAENAGAMLGIGSSLPESMRFVFFVLFVGIVLVAAIAFVLVKPLHNVTVLAISLVVGGGISNIIDRLIRNGSVIDFMLIKIGSLESGIFNVADLAITLGMCILCFSFISLKVQNT